MIVLALDTALSAISAAVLQDGAVLAAHSEPMERGHSERIGGVVRAVMAASGLGFGDLDRIGVTVGPGSFTGLRVGLAFAKGLAVALNVPCVGVGTLEALAYEVHPFHGVAAVIDARRGCVYLELFIDNTSPQGPAMMSVEDANTYLSPGGASLVLAGPGARLLSPAGRIEFQPSAYPDPVMVAKIASNVRPPIEPPRPIYLRPVDAKTIVERAAERAAAQGDDGRIEFVIASPGKPADMAAIHASAFDEAWTAEAIETLLASPGVVSVAVADAFILIRIVADEAEILTLAVRPAARKQGFGGGLVETASREARKAGAKRLFLEVAADNVAALALYERTGFAPVGRRKGYYARRNASPVDALVLSRSLSPSA